MRMPQKEVFGSLLNPEPQQRGRVRRELIDMMISRKISQNESG